MFTWLKRHPRGVLPTPRVPWVAVPGFQALAFKDAHPDATNDVSFAHEVQAYLKGCRPDYIRACMAEAQAVVRQHPGRVVFLFPASAR